MSRISGIWQVNSEGGEMGITCREEDFGDQASKVRRCGDLFYLP